MERRRFSRLYFFIILILLVNGCGYTTMALHPEATVVQRQDPNYPKSIVIYDSCSGNTRQVAQVMAEKLQAPAVHVDGINEYELDGFDLVVVGSPVHGGRPTAKIKAFLSELPPPPMSAVFVTFGAPLFGPLTANACLKKMEKGLHGTSLGSFKCHGFHKIIRTYAGHPDDKDMSDAALFAEALLEKYRHAAKSAEDITD